MKPLSVVHIGLPKTASTFLQRIYFPRTKKYQFYATEPSNCLPSPFRWVYGINHAKHVRKILGSNPSRGDLDRIMIGGLSPNRWTARCRKFLQEQKKPILISSEGFCGISWNPLINSAENLNMLRASFGDFKAIIIIRKQDDFAESIWRQIIFRENRFRYFVKFADFFPEHEESFKLNNNFFCPISELDWSVLVGQYQQVLGAEKVLCLPYEMLVREPEIFFSSIRDFTDDDIDVDDEPWKTRIHNFENAPVYETASFGKLGREIIGGVIRKDTEMVKQRARIIWAQTFSRDRDRFGRHLFVPLTPYQKHTILEKVRQSNKKLSKMINFDLNKLGYY